MYEQEHLLTELETNLVRASTGKRFANYIIDIISFYILAVIVGVFIALVSPSYVDEISKINSFVDRIISMIFMGLYMGTIEAITKGRSLGKLITKTKAVMEDGSKISAATAFARGFSRIVPFEPFSALGGSVPNPWHDRWTKTMVIDLSESMITNNQ